MNKIPQKLRAECNADPYYEKCCLTGNFKKFGYRLEFHHAWIYAGKQIQEKWNIMPIWWRKHDRINGDDDGVHKCKETEDRVKHLALLRADMHDLERRMPKKNWKQELKYLNNKFKNYEQRNKI